MIETRFTPRSTQLLQLIVLGGPESFITGVVKHALPSEAASGRRSPTAIDAGPWVGLLKNIPTLCLSCPVPPPPPDARRRTPGRPGESLSPGSLTRFVVSSPQSFGWFPLIGEQAFLGDHSAGVTPVPIPNTAVKPSMPMILPPRESRSSPSYEPRQPKAGGVLFLRAFC